MQVSLNKKNKPAVAKMLLADNLNIKSNRMLADILNAMPHWVLLLNNQRQIVFANAALLKSFGLKDDHQVLGWRNGDLLSCINASKGGQGCGSSDFCKYCGAVKAGQQNLTKPTRWGECHITTEQGNNVSAYDLRVNAHDFELNGKTYTLFNITDISNEKRRAALERIFFHDILNTAGALKASVDLLTAAPDKETKKTILGILPATTNRLIDEIFAQQELLKAETGDLKLHLSKLGVSSLLWSVVSQVQSFQTANNKKLLLHPPVVDFTIETDKTLLGRVLMNMIKNALEAAPEESAIDIGAELEQEFARFWVRNPGEMPLDVQMQVFKRSFSTKGRDRGLGTYSMKLLTERYLNGKIDFYSNTNTTFWLVLPIASEKTHG